VAKKGKRPKAKPAKKAGRGKGERGPAAAPTPGRKAEHTRAATPAPDPPRRVWLLFLGGATLATLAFFGSFIMDHDVMIFGSDMIAEAYPARAFAVQEVEAGRGLPHWNPLVYAGMPYLSILPYPVWYPTSLLYFFIDLHRAIGWAFVVHFLLAGLLAYALARELRVAPGAAAVAGIAYMFTGYIVSHLHAGQDGRMFAMQLTPALFLFAERAIARLRVHWFLWLSLIAALQVLTPHVQMMYFAGLAVGAYVVFRLTQTWRADRAWRPTAVLLAGFVGAYLLAGLITMVEVWPTLEIVQFTHRAERGYDYASSWAMPVQETLAVIWPEFQGYLETYWGTNPFKLHTEYLGAVPVLLALVAVCAWRTPRVLFFAALALGALLFAWGGATPLHRIAYWILPMMKSFRAPAMMFSIVALAVAVLAAFGAQALYDRRAALADGRHLVWKVAGGLGIVWVVLWLWAAGSPTGFLSFWSGLLYGGIDPQRSGPALAAMAAFGGGFGIFALVWALAVGVLWASARGVLTPIAACAVLALLALVDLWRVDRDFYSTYPVAELVEPDPAIRFLQEQPEPFRVLPTPDAYGPNDLMLFGISSATGSQKFRLRWWDDLVGEDLSRLADPRLWSILDVRYLVTPQAISDPALIAVHESGGPNVYRWGGAPAHAWVVHEARARRADVEPVMAILDPALDPFRTAILEPGVTPPALGPANQPARVAWRGRVPDAVAIDVDATAPGILVTSEVYHPYWRATVDGRPAEVLQVDVALRGVPVPAGRHRVVMTFEDPDVGRGAWASAGGIVLWLGLVAATWRRRGVVGERERTESA
jgi:hypothetical protein